MFKTLRSQEGYLLIDHRASPGTTRIPEGRQFEAPTITCSHCGTVVICNPLRTRPRNYCSKCDHYICDNAGCNAECRPFARLLDDLEKQSTLLIP